MITIAIIGLTVIVSLYAMSDSNVFHRLSLKPNEMFQSKSGFFNLISAGFVHAGIPHLAFNMITLFFFGSTVEKNLMSPVEFLIFYLLSMLLGNLIAAQKYKSNKNYEACGASGAVSAVMFCLVLYQPWSKIYLHFFIPIYYVFFAVGYLIYSWYMDTKKTSNIAHDIHLYGSLFGLAYMLLAHPESFRIFLNQIVKIPF